MIARPARVFSPSEKWAKVWPEDILVRGGIIADILHRGFEMLGNTAQFDCTLILLR